MTSNWHQQTITLPAYKRGFHIITDHITSQLPVLSEVAIGQLHLWLQHTSASLTINENADPSVRSDLETWFNHTVKDDTAYFTHTCEGPDDMPAHIKASLLGCEVMIPIKNGRLQMGTWQGIILAEHRNFGGNRRIVATVQGLWR
ncbi:secondary thiamine-phosphate synthase enzyme YjbQ [Aestuariibacter sp. A3R04]|uniref:secondary thiamine-phosphate synthase enzyme YjbQ n=1 Tax=Aestuariibacter sp. A3R04 TaxID=2841571 RepID=UPI001C08F740|nr:secondary thiamine-phosphate synthase enzyme YjbQ [Aestuariibacter sp. A3R04]MBU3023607.1 secondary thiamine-phosphate synthase enzyme YjbQ [Aestuariibacter sp. A3R04]